MRLTQVTLSTDSRPPTAADAAALVDAIWAAARPEDDLEHVSARPDLEGITVGVFTRTAEIGRPAPPYADLIHRACAMSPLFRNFSTSHSSDIPIADLAPDQNL